MTEDLSRGSLNSFTSQSENLPAELSELEINIYKLTMQNEVGQIAEILKQNANGTDLSRIKDKNRNTLVHKCAANNQFQLLKSFIQAQTAYEANLESNRGDQHQIQLKITVWINQINDEKYTALHYACYRGNIDIISYLDQQGADFQAKNVQGLTIIHMAAQGDQPRSIAYFRKKGVNLNQVDHKQGTALHWACFLGFEQTVNYLCAWNVEMNKQDQEGYTPLHLAVLSGNSKIVRKLLLRGSNRNLRDSNNKRPIDLALDLKFVNITNMLMIQNCIRNLVNIRPTYKPTDNRFTEVIIFIVLYLYSIGTTIMFTFPLLSFWVDITYLVLCTGTFLLFLVLQVKNPGFLTVEAKKKRAQATLLQLLAKYDASQICPDCELVKADRSRHCEICRECVSVYDHHCQWINNCVGSRNHGLFIAYIILVWIMCLLTLVVNSMKLVHKFDNYYNHVFTWFEDMGNELFQLKIIIGSVNIGISLGFTVPMCILIWTQVNNALLNRTTFERFSQHKPDGKKDQASLSTEVNDINQSLINVDTKEMSMNESPSCKNCKLLCCDNQQDQRYAYVSL